MLWCFVRLLMMKNKNPQHVVWLQTAFIGDIILSTGAMRLLADRYPHIKQHVITTKAGVEILKPLAFLSSVQAFEKKGLGLKAYLQIKKSLAPLNLNKNNTVILQPHRSVRSSLLSTFLRFPVITYEETNLSIFAACRVPRISVFHEVVRIALLLEPLGVAREEVLAAKPYLTPTTLRADLQLEGKLIGIAPGSIWGTKRWPIASFKTLAQKLQQQHPDYRIVLLGSKDEKALADEIEQSLPKDSLLNLAGKTNLPDLCAIFPRLSLLIANDSSPIHFASAFNVPTIALFGSTIPQLGFAPLADHSRTLGVELTCRPCSDHGPQVCPLGHFQCMKLLSVGSVLAACREIVNLL
jgi:heptosyltransferase-2